MEKQCLKEGRVGHWDAKYIDNIMEEGGCGFTGICPDIPSQNRLNKSLNYSGNEREIKRRGLGLSKLWVTFGLT